MPTTSQYLTQLQQDREDLVDNLETQGISDLTGNETFTELVPKVLDIETGGGDTPEKGIIIKKWNENGYPLDVEYVGRDSVDSYYFTNEKDSNTQGFFSQVTNIKLPITIQIIPDSAFRFLKKLVTINLSDDITSINQYAFQNCTNLALTSLPSGITSINQYAFQNCTNLALTSLPSGITGIGQYAFQNCTNLALTSLPSSLRSLNAYSFSATKVNFTSFNSGLTSVGMDVFRSCTSIKEFNTKDCWTIPGRLFYQCTNLKKVLLPKASTITGTNANNPAFYQCTGLKQVWIGSSLINNGAQRYPFYGCTNLEKIYIDLPRATVEAFTNYQYAFMNETTKTGIIICNDDADFITQEEFDAIDVETL